MLSNIQVPKANTQRHVSQTVFQFLEKFGELKNSKFIIDVPCGEGQFSKFLKDTYPAIDVVGVDGFAENTSQFLNFKAMKAQEFFRTVQPKNADAITCISGVMCFDGLDELFVSFRDSLKRDGILVVTNDSVMTVRDRLNFLVFGRLKRFKLNLSANEGNWNVVMPQAIWMHLQKNKFVIEDVKYTSIYLEDWILLPLALLFYPLFLASVLLSSGDISRKDRMKFFPFISLLARHYVIVARKLG
jgi:SAM-dependent methyltransferase